MENKTNFERYFEKEYNSWDWYTKAIYHFGYWKLCIVLKVRNFVNILKRMLTKQQVSDVL